MIGGDLFRWYTYGLGGNGAVDRARPASLGVGVSKFVRVAAADPIIRAKPAGWPLREMDATERWTQKRLRT